MSKRDWIRKAACTDMEPGMFFADEPNYDEITALQTCVDCPARNLCLTEALADEGSADARSRHGIRGGMTPGERASLDRKVRRPGTRTPTTNAGHPHAPAAIIAERFRLAEKGLSNREIADREGANIDAIRSWRKRNGLAS